VCAHSHLTSAYIYTYVYAYVCVDVCAHSHVASAYIYTYICVCIQVWSECTTRSTHTGTLIHTQTHIFRGKPTLTHTQHTHTDTHTLTYTHTHTRTHTHTYCGRRVTIRSWLSERQARTTNLDGRCVCVCCACVCVCMYTCGFWDESERQREMMITHTHTRTHTHTHTHTHTCTRMQVKRFVSRLSQRAGERVGGEHTLNRRVG